MENIIGFYKKLNNYWTRKYPSFKRLLFGMKTSDGLIFKLVMYFLIFVIGFVFIYPLLYMLSISLMSNVDLVDNTVRWIPTRLNFTNYTLTFRALRLPWSLFTTIAIAGVPTLAVAVSSAFVGYGLSRFNFFGKKLIIVLIIFTFILPKTLFFIPTHQIYIFLDNLLFSGVSFKLKASIFPIVAPALTGQGLNAAFFILIFYQFFAMIPKSLEEAALIDGASAFQIFRKIAIPTAVPALIITFVYAFSLYWNETFLINYYYVKGEIKTIPTLLANIQQTYSVPANMRNPRDPNLDFTETKRFAATLLSITPLIVMYAIVQRWFVESIDKSGITGE